MWYEVEHRNLGSLTAEAGGASRGFQAVGMGSLLVLLCGYFFPTLQRQQVIGSFSRIMGSAENLVLVVLERLDPRGDIGGVAFRLVGNTPLCRQEKGWLFQHVAPPWRS